MNKFAFALAGALALTACKTEEQKPEHEGMSKDEISAQIKAEQAVSMQTRLDNYLIDVNGINVTRNGESFALDAQAFCNTVPQDNIESYTAACTQSVAEQIQTQFACAGHSIPPAMVRTTNENIIRAGMQGRYDDHYLDSDDKLKKAITQNDKSRFKEDYIRLTDASDMDALESTYILEGNKPESCPS